MDINTINPTTKDIERAEGLSFQNSTFYGNGSPFTSSASKMAKLIKDKRKLVGRAKAVVDRWGTRDYCGLSDAGRTEHIENVWIPFRDALKNAGFTNEEILSISRYRSK